MKDFAELRRLCGDTTIPVVFKSLDGQKSELNHNKSVRSALIDCNAVKLFIFTGFRLEYHKKAFHSVFSHVSYVGVYPNLVLMLVCQSLVFGDVVQCQ